MQIIENNPVVLIADEGKMITDGTAYGTLWYLAENRTVEEFYEITEEEFNQISEEQNSME